MKSKLHITFVELYIYIFVRVIILFIVLYAGVFCYFICQNHLMFNHNSLQKRFNHISLSEIFVISLDRTPERYNVIANQFNNLGIKHKRYRACDGYKVLISNGDAKHVGEDIVTGKFKFKDKEIYEVECGRTHLTYEPDLLDKYQRFLGPGELGCLFSHINILKEMVNNKYKHILVLEDDVTITNDFKDSLANLLQKFPTYYDLMYLFINPEYPLSERNTAKILNNEKIMRMGLDSVIIGAVAYIVSYEGAKKILQNLKGMRKPIDLIYSELIGEGVLTAYATRNNLLETPVGEAQKQQSVISSMGRK